MLETLKAHKGAGISQERLEASRGCPGRACPNGTFARLWLRSRDPRTIFYVGCVAVGKRGAQDVSCAQERMTERNEVRGLRQPSSAPIGERARESRIGFRQTLTSFTPIFHQKCPPDSSSPPLVSLISRADSISTDIHLHLLIIIYSF
jgi:hypothetical protein